MTGNDYGLPTICNFPIIDAVLPPYTGLQMTTSASHEVSATYLESMLTNLEIKSEEFNVVFVVPDEILTSFKFPSNLGNVNMFVTVSKAMTETVFKALFRNKKRKQMK